MPPRVDGRCKYSVIAKAGTDGKFCLFSSQAIDAVVDVTSLATSPSDRHGPTGH